MDEEFSSDAGVSRIVREAAAKVRKQQADERLETVRRVQKAEEQEAVRRWPEKEDDPFPDSDEDGLSDAQEFALGTDMARSDSDGDGVGDGEEVFGRTVDTWDSRHTQLHRQKDVRSDPLDADTDDDGLHDSVDNLPLRHGYRDHLPHGRTMIVADGGDVGAEASETWDAASDIDTQVAFAEPIVTEQQDGFDGVDGEFA